MAGPLISPDEVRAMIVALQRARRIAGLAGACPIAVVVSGRSRSHNGGLAIAHSSNGVPILYSVAVREGDGRYSHMFDRRAVEDAVAKLLPAPPTGQRWADIRRASNSAATIAACRLAEELS